jgi:hypothetical protein
MKLTFIELPLFTSLVTQITDDHFLNQLQNDLLKDPEKGDLIPHMRGLRKVRMALQGRRCSGHLPLSPSTPRGHILLHIYQGQVGEPHSGPGASSEGRC